MCYRILFILFFLGSSLLYGQDCPNLLNPIANSTNIPVDTSISWEDVPGVNSYVISLGTTPGGTDIVNEQGVGGATTFSPPLGLPAATQVHVTITLFFFNQPNVVCPSLSFTTANVTTIPACTVITDPVDGEQNVNVSTSITWSYAPRATGYRITVGTAPGLGDIANNLDVGNVLFYDPPANFPFSTQIFVRIIPYNNNGAITSCEEEAFTTASAGTPPVCAQIISPMNGATDVELSPFIEWTAVPGATGYIVSIGTTPFDNDVLDAAVFTANSTFVINFEANSTYFITIIPFNNAGQAQGCQQFSFSTILGCGPFIDPKTGELITLNPEINFPDVVGICENSLPTQVSTQDVADGFRWYEVRPTGDELLISEERTAPISTVGPYRYEAYNIIDQEGVIIECASTKEFTVIASSTATIDDIVIEEIANLFYVTVVVSGIGSYEFALDDREGPYTDDPVFSGLSEGTYTVYVRDKNGCGIVEQEFRLALPPPGFPPYFSPNDDGINDTWHYVPPRVNPLIISNILIYDRFGKLLAQIGRFTPGWDGRFEGKPMSPSDYWYRAILADGSTVSGHFSLVRYRRP